MKRFAIISFIMILLSVNVFATKRALVIGLGRQQDSSWSKIHGDNDVVYVQKMLKSCGYSSGNTMTIVNEKATKRGLMESFKKLAEQCKSGDIVYIHFSGHGQQVVDKNKVKRESWIPYDACKENCANDKGEKHLIDYEINELLKKINNKIGNGGKLLVVVDACCSANSVRGDDEGNDEDDVACRGTDDEFMVTSFELPKQELKAPWITLSACQSYEKAWEIQGLKVGKLTYALYSVIVEAKKKGITCDKFVKLFEKYQEDWLKTNKIGKRQKPEGEKNECNYDINAVLK